MITHDTVHENPNLQSDEAVQVQAWLDEYSGSSVALADLLCDRHAADPQHVALRYTDASGGERTYTFAELRELSARFAGVLGSLSLVRGDRVATLLPQVSGAGNRSPCAVAAWGRPRAVVHRLRATGDQLPAGE
jgi:hypothetical protein